MAFSFLNQRTLHRDPELNLNGVAIPVTDEVKFLGLTLDRNLSFIPYIQNLKQRCLKPSITSSCAHGLGCRQRHVVETLPLARAF